MRNRLVFLVGVALALAAWGPAQSQQVGLDAVATADGDALAAQADAALHRGQVGRAEALAERAETAFLNRASGDGALFVRPGGGADLSAKLARIAAARRAMQQGRIRLAEAELLYA